MKTTLLLFALALLMTSASAQPLIPVTFGKKNDGLPEKLKVRGVITELSFALAYCGVVFWSGTMKIKLLDKPKGYPHENVFVVVPCFFDPNNESKYLNKTVNLELHKLYETYRGYKKENPCAFETIINRIQSGGIPFYCSSEGQDYILRNIEKEEK